MATIVTRKVKELHAELATKWGFPARVIAGATLGVAVTMMLDQGYTEEEIAEVVRGLVGGTP